MNEGNSAGKSKNIRLMVLLGILLIVGCAFLYDKYVLMPSSTEKINQIVNKVALKLSPENRQQIRDIVGFEPSSTFTHNGLEVEQYRFPRGLPFFPKPILDVAFQGDTLAFFRQEPMDKAYIDQNHRPQTEIDRTLKEDPGEPVMMGSGG